MKKVLFYMFSVLCAFCMSACSDDSNVDDTTLVIDVPVITDITFNSAEVKAVIKDAEFVERGVCYSTFKNPNMLNNKIVAGDATDEFSVVLKDLSSNTKYYVRSYAVLQDNSVVYSEIVDFSTLANEDDELLGKYTPPMYSDNYMAINNWAYHDKWNLANIHDPDVFKADDGYYYMYQTDASYGDQHMGDGGHFHGRRSKDLVNWEYLGGTMREIPAWVNEKLNEYRKKLGLPGIQNPNWGFWAPTAGKVRDGLYRMYYSIIIFDPIDANNNKSSTERAFIGLMETSDPASNVWEDKGFVITSSSNRGKNWTWEENQWEETYFKFNAIDPSFFIDNDGKHWLIYGSWHSGIAAVELDAETGKVKQELPDPWGNDIDIEAYGTRIATRNGASRWQGSEAPEIIYRNNYYYLFLAYDAVDVPYNTRVVRSKNLLGPYYGLDGTDVTNTGGEAYPVLTHPYKFENSYGWVGFSHCGVFEDGNDNWFYVSQARFPDGVPGIYASNVVMMGHVRRILWTEDGWPVVLPERYGAVPDVKIKESELCGTWECINLKYEYGVQQESWEIVLDPDHKITSGDWKGRSWTYDENKQVLTIDETIKLCVAREVDWEREPRTHTLVFAGYEDINTYWGKLKK